AAPPAEVAAAPAAPPPAAPPAPAPADAAAAPGPRAPEPASPVPTPVSTNNPYPPGTAGHLTELAKQAFSRGDHDAAIETTRKALALDARWAEAIKVMGMAYQAKGDPHRAVKAFKDYLKVAPLAADADDVKKLVAALGG